MRENMNLFSRDYRHLENIRKNMNSDKPIIEFIKETENVLSISKGGGYLFAKYFIDANSKIIQYDYPIRHQHIKKLNPKP